jgi:hypothetical protein
MLLGAISKIGPGTIIISILVIFLPGYAPFHASRSAATVIGCS